MEIAIVGVGAIGGVMAAALEAAGHDVILCARAGFGELVLHQPSGFRRVKARIVQSPREVTVTPWVVLATKAHQVTGAAAWLATLCGPTTTVAIVQNGVEHEQRVSPYCDGAALVPVVIECRADRVSSGHVLQRTPADLVVPDSDGGRRFVALLAGSDVRATVVEDFVTAVWRKLCVNVAGGAITALTDKPVGVIRRPDVAEVARELIRECIRVGRATGAHLDDELADTILTSMIDGPPEAETSMLADRRARKLLEVDARNGAVVRIGARHGIPTPINRAFTALLAAIGGDA